MTSPRAYGVPHDTTIFVIDPPWPQKKGGRRSVRPNQGRALDYSTLSVDDIFELLDQDVFPSDDRTHTVFMWTIEKFLDECQEQMDRRDYRRHIRLIWDKGNGIAPAFSVRFSHEYLVWYYRPKFTPVAQEQRGKFLSVIREPAREHSRKPDAAYAMIESCYPDATKTDVFSRERRDGWCQYGDQVDFF